MDKESKRFVDFVDPEETRQEIAKVLVKGLERSLTEEEARIVYWLGDADLSTREVILNLFWELEQRIEYFKEE